MAGPTGSFDKDGNLDISRSPIITGVGKKRSGKSVMGLLWFQHYPGDRVVIDVAGDDGPTPASEPDVVELHGTVDDLPSSWPEMQRRDDRPMTLRYVPDMGSPTRLEDMDHVVGLAMAHGDCMILIHEVGRVAPANRTPPHMSRLLESNRHRNVSAVFLGPRPQGIDPLVLAQADLVYVFTLPNPNDRRRVAECIGWPPAEFDAAVHDLGEHEYLRYDDNMPAPAEGEPDLRLVHFEPLPADVVAGVTRWARAGTSKPRRRRPAGRMA